MDQKGYIISVLSFLLIIPAVLMIVVFVDMANTGVESQSLTMQSDATFYTAKDVEGNIPVITERILQKTANDVIKSGNPLPNSEIVIKNRLQEEMDHLSEMYGDNEGINVTCKIWSVDPSPDPSKIEVKSTVYVRKGNVAHNESISQNVSIMDPNYPIPDPLPFINAKGMGELPIQVLKLYMAPVLQIS